MWGGGGVTDFMYVRVGMGWVIDFRLHKKLICWIPFARGRSSWIAGLPVLTGSGAENLAVMSSVVEHVVFVHWRLLFMATLVADLAEIDVAAGGRRSAEIRTDETKENRGPLCTTALLTESPGKAEDLIQF